MAKAGAKATGSKNEGKKATGGRPRRSAEDGLLSRSLTFRVRPPLYAKIQEAAEKELRSLSEEIEARLLSSFRQEALEADRFGDRDVAFLANLIAATVSLEHRRTKKSFLTDEATYKNVQAAIFDAYETMAREFHGQNVLPNERKAFDRHEYTRISRGPVDNAAFAAESLEKIMGR